MSLREIRKKLRHPTKNRPAPVLGCVPVPLDGRPWRFASNFLHRAVLRGTAQMIELEGRHPENARNEFIRMFLTGMVEKKFYNEILEATHLFFLDADTAPTDEYAIEQLLAHDKPVVAGVTPIYKRESRTWQWSAWPEGSDKPLGIKDLPRKPFKAKWVGGTTLLVRRDVLNAMEQPYQKEVQDELGRPILSEDFYFCDKIRELGVDIWVDPGIQCRHWHSCDLLEMSQQIFDK